MEADIGIKKVEKITNLLNATLADLYVLTTKTKKYHWNITGPRFMFLHEMFQKQYEAMDDFIDEVAERITSLGTKAIGTLDEFQKASQLEEHPEDFPDEEGMIEDLLTDHEIIVKTIRKNIAICSEHEDEGSADLYVQLIRFHEKTAWMLRSHLEE